MKNLITAFFAFSSFYVAVYSQPLVKKADTAFFTNAHRKTTHKDSADYFTVRNYDREDSNRVVMRKHSMNGRVLGENHFSDFRRLIKNGINREYFPSGALAKEISYVNNKMEGAFNTFHENGKIKRRDWYKSDTLLTGQCFSNDGKDTNWYAYEQEPQFPGGPDSLIKFIRKTLVYPHIAQLQGMEGTVNILFTVTRDGAVTAVRLYKRVSPVLDAEAIRVVNSMPHWIPGKRDGEPTSWDLVLPVVFRLNH